MVVRFTKARHADRPHTMTCVRADGSTDGMASSAFFVRHDLTHFAIESVLGLENAFFGLVSGEWSIRSFEEREPGSRRSRTLPPEAMLAEVLAGALDLDWAAAPIPPEEVANGLQDRLGGVPIPPERITEIRARRAALLDRWSALDPGESMELIFAPSAMAN